MRQCSSCATPLESPLLCARCKSAYYCNPTCQKAHWPTHKKSCKAAVNPVAVLNPLVVLQGEVGFSKASKKAKPEPFIKTSTPTKCTVVTLYYKKGDQTAALLAHVDEYTSVSALMVEISSILSQRFGGLSLDSAEFDVKIMGGLDTDPSSFAQKGALRSAFARFSGAHITEIDLGGVNRRPQILLNTQNGAIELLYDSKANQMLELLQEAEYADFDSYILSRPPYLHMSGEELPYFLSKEARRHEVRDLPVTPGPSLSSAKLELERLEELYYEGRLEVPTSWERRVDARQQSSKSSDLKK